MILATNKQNVILRPWAIADQASHVKYGNNKLGSRNLTDMFPHSYTNADALEWVAIVTILRQASF